MQRNLLRVASAFLIVIGLTACSTVARAVDAAPVVVVTHVDVAPPRVAEALALLKGYAGTTRKEPGNLEVELLRQTNGNHFTLVERWANLATHENHVASPATRGFHQRFDAMLGSPHDERLYREL